MYTKAMKLKWIFVLGLSLFLVSCGSSVDKGSAPIISNISISPSTFRLNQNGGSSTSSISFYMVDPDIDLNIIFVTNGTSTLEFPFTYSNQITQGFVAVSFPVNTSQIGTRTLEVSCEDKQGNLSNILTGSLTIN